jgi:hypothetical protein
MPVPALSSAALPPPYGRSPAAPPLPFTLPKRLDSINQSMGGARRKTGPRSSMINGCERPIYSEPASGRSGNVEEPLTSQRVGDSGFRRISAYRNDVEGELEERRLTEKSQRILNIATSFGQTPPGHSRHISTNNRVVPDTTEPLRRIAQEALNRPGPPTQAQVDPQSEDVRDDRQPSGNQEALVSARSEVANQAIAVDDLWEI